MIYDSMKHLFHGEKLRRFNDVMQPAEAFAIVCYLPVYLIGYFYFSNFKRFILNIVTLLIQF